MGRPGNVGGDRRNDGERDGERAFVLDAMTTWREDGKERTVLCERKIIEFLLIRVYRHTLGVFSPRPVRV